MSLTKQKEVNKWDNPSSEDVFGRSPFVDTIVKTIESSDKGFNLGISGRWGEGKSSILKQLRPKLESLNYKVLTFEPWKYTQDQISIKRKFIIDIYSQLGKDYDDTPLYGSTQKDSRLKLEEYRQLFSDQLSLFFLFSGIVSIIFLFVLWLFQQLTGTDINITKTFLTNLFIPVIAGMLPLITKITEVTVKQTLPRIESAEQFESLFNNVINEIMDGCDPPKQIVIFVDDLDRCNHTEVEQILTALFTFFNNKRCTYVITADHTVIRRYISRFLQLGDEIDANGNVDIKKTNEVRQKEATEYLKKIFQINFILPKISNDLFEPWVRELLKENAVISFKNPYAEDYLVKMILNNFHSNPRKVKYFVRTLVFQLEAINEKILILADKESEESKNLLKVKESPELLAKILIIQDRFPDFYETVIAEPKLLQRHESGEPAMDKDLQNLLAQEPKFFDSITRTGVMKSIDPYYFLYFSGSTGFAEVETIDPAEILALAKSADFEGLTTIISGQTDAPRNAQVAHLKKVLDDKLSIIVPSERVNLVRSLLHVISLIEEPSLRLQKLKDILNDNEKYTTEFTSLQSVDYDKFLPFIDMDIANRLFTEAPFTLIGPQSHILNAFISQQEKISVGDITNRFIELIASGIKKNTPDSITFVDFARKLSDVNFVVNDNLQEALLETYSKVTNPLKEGVFDFLAEKQSKLLSVRQSEFEKIILNTIENGTISESISMFGKVPTKINKENFDFKKIIDVILKRVAIANTTELEQLLNILIHPAIKAEFAVGEFDKIISAFVDQLGTVDPTKNAYIRSKLTVIISNTEDKTALFKKIPVAISLTGLSESSSTMAVVQGMSDFWNDNQDLKKVFAKELKTVAKKIKDNDVKDLMIKSSNELVPPMMKKEL